MTFEPRNKLTLLNTHLHENYFCPFCGTNSYNKGKIQICDHLRFIWRDRDDDSENALIYVTDSVRKLLSEEKVDHDQIYEFLCLETPFRDSFTIEEIFL
jgi:hypothetical protein